MNTNIKKLINPIILIAVGLFNFIFLALNALRVSVSYSGQSKAEGISSGYGLLGLNTKGADAGFLVTLAGILSILTIIASIVLMAIGTLKLLKALNVAVPALDQYQNVISMGEKYTLIGNFSIQIASFVFLLIFGLANSSSAYYKVSYGPGIGAYLLLIFAIAAFVLVKFVFTGCEDAAPGVEYTCSQCGAKAKATDKFCATCGGEVKATVKYPTVYACAQCGAKATASNKFCSNCGGEIVQKKLIPTVYCCSQCGAKAKATDKFCATCGGAIVEKSADAE